MLIIQIALGIVLGVVLLTILPYIPGFLLAILYNIPKILLGSVLFVISLLAGTVIWFIVAGSIMAVVFACVFLLNSLGFINWWICLFGGVFLGAYLAVVIWERILHPILKRVAPGLLDFLTEMYAREDEKPDSVVKLKQDH